MLIDRDKLGTKAETLSMLYGKMKNARILPVFYFTVGDWRKNKEKILGYYNDLNWNSSVIIRSSALNEDIKGNSMAGKFESVFNVKNIEGFVSAVNKVIASYDNEDENNQILVQPMLNDVEISGVAFTLDPNTKGNYYVINYNENGLTDTVTSGTGENDKLVYVFKGRKPKNSKKIIKICDALEELEQIFGQDNLDVEFAIIDGLDLVIFQVRTLCVNGARVDLEKQKKDIKRIEEKIHHMQTSKPFLHGKKTIYGVMSDWNPAEIIGLRPKTLALSLYKEIITDNIWAYQRDNYGYRNLRSFPLMVDFCGLPYIDIRVSFNSFVPAGLNEKISEKLVNYYLSRLEEDPTKHDKVEFEIVFSCYTLNLPERIHVLRKYGFSEDEISQIVEALRKLTNNITGNINGLWKKDYEKLNILEKRYAVIVNSNLSKIEKIYWLLEDCKRYGTLPFAGLARAAFIAVQMLQSMVDKKIISQEDYHKFMNGVSTVSSNLKSDLHKMSKENFLLKYGHLRPGTYDINSKRYDEAPDAYFDWKSIQQNNISDIEKPQNEFRLSMQQMHRLADELNKNGLNNDILELLDFIKSVIEGREYGKFLFTKNLSMIIRLIGDVGEEYGFSRKECAYLDIQDVKSLYAVSEDIESTFKNSIEKGEKKYETTEVISIPPVIVSEKDVWLFEYPSTIPNYITLNSAYGEVAVIEGDWDRKSFADNIVLIESADPGYDWIFSRGIKGFITMYGGANSHMAVRAGELGIPAAVGVGKTCFEQLKCAQFIELDTQTKIIRIIR